MEIPCHWRLKAQRYRLEGSICPNCVQPMFPTRPVCPDCNAPLARITGGELPLVLTSTCLTDIESHIKFEKMYTPITWHERYNLVKGSTHGLSHQLKPIAYLRPSNRHPRYRNLYFVGASTHPGAGMPTAMVSGRLVSERIMDELGA